jgi:hypothetical protein
MALKWTKNFIAIALSLFVFSTGFAQGQSEEKTKSSGPRKQLATIIFAGLGGAVLGLSTLSFYGRPQDNLSNIAVGFAVGVITGTVIVTYRAATNPAEFYGAQYRPDESYKIASQLTAFQPPNPLKVNYHFEF